MRAPPPRYAIWLLPSGCAARQFSRAIAGLAERYQAPGFEPHITLASAVASDELGARCEQLAAVGKPFRVQPSGLRGGSDFFRHLYVDIAPCELLLTLRREILNGSGAPQPYRPHLSLLYRQNALRDRSGYRPHTDALPLAPFELAQLALVQLDSRVEHWKTLGRWPLAAR